jgi:hypothetical protein
MENRETAYTKTTSNPQWNTHFGNPLENLSEIPTKSDLRLLLVEVLWVCMAVGIYCLLDYLCG